MVHSGSAASLTGLMDEMLDHEGVVENLPFDFGGSLS